MGEFPSRQNQFTADYQPDNRGRPKGSLSLTSILRKYMDCEIVFRDPLSNEVINSKIQNVIVLQLISKAVRGDLKAIIEIFDRLEGRPTIVSRNFDLDAPRKLTVEFVHVVRNRDEVIPPPLSRESSQFNGKTIFNS